MQIPIPWVWGQGGVLRVCISAVSLVASLLHAQTALDRFLRPWVKHVPEHTVGLLTSRLHRVTGYHPQTITLKSIRYKLSTLFFFFKDNAYLELFLP